MFHAPKVQYSPQIMHAQELLFASASWQLLAFSFGSLAVESCKTQEHLCRWKFKAQELLCSSNLESQELLCGKIFKPQELLYSIILARIKTVLAKV